jgi:hypothetical protein
MRPFLRVHFDALSECAQGIAAIIEALEFLVLRRGHQEDRVRRTEVSGSVNVL